MATAIHFTIMATVAPVSLCDVTATLGRVLHNDKCVTSGFRLIGACADLKKD